MRLLVIAMVESSHTANWLNTLTNEGHEIFLFAPYLSRPHKDLEPVRRTNGVFFQKGATDKINYISALPHPFLGDGLEWSLNKIKRDQAWRANWLAMIIRTIKPDLLHSMEFQQAGYLSLQAYEILKGNFPPWLATIWGSDLYYFGQFEEHKPRIKRILSLADFFSCECMRDVKLAQQMGLKGRALKPGLVSGGYDLKRARELQSKQPTSERRLIVIKGYQHFAGRALIALKALELCSDHLNDYKIRLHSSTPDVIKAVNTLGRKSGLDIACIPHTQNQEDILALHGQARISIGLSISDGISVSMLEAMIMGSFPIQSCTSCANEWIEDGKSGFIVPAEDPIFLSLKIISALNNDTLVNHARELNWKTAEKKLSSVIVKSHVINTYKEILDNISTNA
ncbi:MAG: glycosyltransferase [Methylocystaceae bacterium]|nr:glycosyltransferase [Methylocystaceae bacterium]